jgi:hypothetical protein
MLCAKRFEFAKRTFATVEKSWVGMIRGLVPTLPKFTTVFANVVVKEFDKPVTVEASCITVIEVLLRAAVVDKREADEI